MKILDIPRSGSYAGFTSSKNRFGQYVRNRRAPVQPIGTGRRAFIRAAFGSASAAWAALSDAEQAAWAAFAESHPIVNSLGASVVLTGHMMYVAVNTQRTNVELGPTATPPSTTEVVNLTGVSLELLNTPSLTVTVTADAASQYILIATSPPLSAGRHFPTRFWQAQRQTTTVDELEIPFTDTWTAEFGLPVVGNRIFVKLTPVNEVGWTGTPTIVSGLVVEPP